MRSMLPLAASLLLLGCAATATPSTPQPTPTLERPGLSATFGDDGSIAFRSLRGALRLRAMLGPVRDTTRRDGALERTRGDVVETIVDRPDGFELLYRFAHAPADRSVRLELADASVVSVGADGAWIHAEGLYRVGHGTLLDARGRSIAVPLRVSGRSLVYELPVDAEYPAVLDPTVDAPIEVEAPTAAEGPDSVQSAAVGGSPQGFLFFWTNPRTRRVCLRRYSPTGTPLDVYPVNAGSFDVVAPKIVGSDTDWLVVSEGLTMSGYRVLADGTVATPPIAISKDAQLGGVAWDGERWVISTRNFAATPPGLLRHVTKAGVVVEPAGVTSTLEGSELACLSKVCVGTTSSGLVRLDASFVATAIATPPFAAGLAASATDFLAMGPAPARLTTAGVATSFTNPAPLDHEHLVTSGSSSGFVSAFRKSSTGELFFVRIPATGTTPTWTLAAVPGSVDAGSTGAFLALSGTRAMYLHDSATAKTFDTATKPTLPFTQVPFARTAPAHRGGAVASDGKDFLVAWIEDRLTGRELRVRRFDAKGTALGASARAFTLRDDVYGSVDVELIFDGTRYHLVARGNDASFVRVRIAKDGTVLDGTPITLAPAPFTARPVTMTGGGGRALAAWVDSGVVQLVRFDDKGDVVDGKPIAIDKTDANGYTSWQFPRVAASFDGKQSLVVWPSISGSSTNLRGVLVGDGAIGASFPVLDADGVQRNPSAAFSGKVHLVAYTELDGGPPKIRVLRVDPTGKVLDAPRTVITGVPAHATSRVSWDGGAFVVTAIVGDATALSPEDLVAARVREDGVPVAEAPFVFTKQAIQLEGVTKTASASNATGDTLALSTVILDGAPYVTSRAQLHALHGKRPRGATCAAGAECDDGQCVDGVCCATACSGPCEACDLPDSLGTCSPVKGAPHGVRACVGGGSSSDPCASGACDGKDVTRCASLSLEVGAVCSAPRCEGSTYVAPATCSSARACAMPERQECAPFRCAEGGCQKTCARDEDCVDRARCVSGSCVPSPTGARCSGDGLTSIQKDGTPKGCAPYRCNTDGACATRCTTSAECVQGFACDVGSGNCAQIQAEPAEEGGCAMGARGGRGGFWLLLGAVAIAARRRRSLMALATVALGCRAEPSSTPAVAATSSSLKASAEISVTDTTTNAPRVVQVGIACHAAGCLTVQQRGPWLVGHRLDATGKILDPKGFLVAYGRGGLDSLAVGANGKDYFVVYGQGAFALVGSLVGRTVSADGKVGAPRELASKTSLAMQPAVGFDGTDWVVAWTDQRSGSTQVLMQRFAPDGSPRDGDGTVLVDGLSSPRASLRCASGGCFVVAGDGTNGRLLHVAGTTIDKGPTSVAWSPLAVMPTSSGIAVLGSASDGTRVYGFGNDLVATGTPKLVHSAPTRVGALVEQSTGALAVASEGPSFTMARLDATFAVTSRTDVSESLYAAGLANLGTTTYFVGPPGNTDALSFVFDGLSKVEGSPPKATQVPFSDVLAEHTLLGVANSPSGSAALIRRRGAGKDSLLIARTDGLTFSTSTVVVAETEPVNTAHLAWDGAQYVVAWATASRTAYARVNASLAVVDAGGIKLLSSSGYIGDTPYRVGVGASPTGSTIVAIDGTSVRAVRLSKSGVALDGTPISTTFSADGSNAAFASASDGSLLLVGVGPSVTVIGVDGKPTKAAPIRIEPGSTLVRQPAGAAFDGTAWVVAFSDARTGTLDGRGRDLRVIRLAKDLSDASTAKSWALSARDADQDQPALAIDAGRGMVTWIERGAVEDELRVSWFDLATKAILVDAAKIGTTGPDEVQAILSGGAGRIVYQRWDSDPAVLASRIKARTFTFGSLAATTCTKNDDCELGFCVDGVCCDRACDGACEACNEPSSVGKCTTVEGAPRGTRTCSGTGCAEATCDGLDGKSCKRFTKGFETRCAPSKCEGALFTAVAYCDGEGACAADKPASCAPYACDERGCLTSCSTDASCALGYFCKDSVCVGPELRATCVDDGLSSKSAEGEVKSCAPFRCGAEGTCLQKCAGSYDCAAGAACDPSSSTCVSGAVSEDSGGCAFGPSPAAKTSGLALLVALLGFVRRRRSTGVASV